MDNQFTTKFIINYEIKSSRYLAEDESLPSIRTLAKDLRISVITTKRSYEELEREGYIYTIPGKGSFVAGKNVQLIQEQNLRIIEEHLAEIKKTIRIL